MSPTSRSAATGVSHTVAVHQGGPLRDKSSLDFDRILRSLMSRNVTNDSEPDAFWVRTRGIKDAKGRTKNDRAELFHRMEVKFTKQTGRASV